VWSLRNETGKVLKEAVKDAQHSLADHLRPEGDSCEETVDKLLTTLDNNEVILLDRSKLACARGSTEEQEAISEAPTCR
jgi:hypothetical protein